VPCPKGLIGPVDVCLAHHGDEDNADPAILAAPEPRIAIENNGLKKGGSRETDELLHRVAGLEDVWQLHRSAKAGDSNFAADRIANIDESTAHGIKLSANEDGLFRVRTNGQVDRLSIATHGRSQLARRTRLPIQELDSLLDDFTGAASRHGSHPR
jgi:hypothetical protein